MNWEYWNQHVVYAPIIFYWFWLCAKSRSFFFFSASNPSIDHGGFAMESKFKIYKLIPKVFQPKIFLVQPGSTGDDLRLQLESSGFSYPVFAKPDIGGRGLGVKKIENEEELVEYLQRFQVPMLVQENIDYKEEAGIFYYRYPGAAKGNISGIVMKEFLRVTGNGVASILELLQMTDRYTLQIPALKKILGDEIYHVPGAGEEKILVPYGNHARGAKFIDAGDLINEELEKTIDDICKQIPGFYFGRLDIKFNNIDDLRQGKHFSIIELNGAGSEPTHIYDPHHSIFFAWKEITRHWNILYRVSRINHKAGVTYMNFKEGRKMHSDEKKYLEYMKQVLGH